MRSGSRLWAHGHLTTPADKGVTIDMNRARVVVVDVREIIYVHCLEKSYDSI